MNRRKLTLRVAVGCGITFLAALAFAPGLTADAIGLPFLTKAAPKTVAAGEQTTGSTQAIPKAGKQPKYVPLPDEKPAAAAPDHQTAPEQNDHGNKGFDGHTTFAMSEVSNLNSLSNTSDARIFRSVGGVGGGEPAAHKGHANSPNGGASSSSPQPNSDDTSKDDKANGDASNGNASNDDQKTEPDNKSTEIALNGPSVTEEKPHASVPEPSSVMLLLAGVCGLCAMRRMS